MEELQSNEFSFTINGDIESIHVHTLVESLTTFDELLAEVNRELDTGKDVTLAVKAHRPGSFEVLLQILPDTTLLDEAVHFLNPANLEIAKVILAVTTGAFKLKKYLKGKKPRRVTPTTGNNIAIENADGNTMEFDQRVVKIAENATFDNCTINIFAQLDAVSGAQGLTISDDKREVQFQVKRDDSDGYKAMKKPNPMIPDDEVEKQDIPVAKASLEYYDSTIAENKKWHFRYQGNVIKADFQDDNFINDWNEGKVNFVVGCKLVADIILHQEYSNAEQTFITKGCTIVDVLRVVPNQYQAKIRFGKNN